MNTCTILSYEKKKIIKSRLNLENILLAISHHFLYLMINHILIVLCFLCIAEYAPL